MFATPSPAKALTCNNEMSFDRAAATVQSSPDEFTRARYIGRVTSVRPNADPAHPGYEVATIVVGAVFTGDVGRTASVLAPIDQPGVEIGFRPGFIYFVNAVHWSGGPDVATSACHGTTLLTWGEAAALVRRGTSVEIIDSSIISSQPTFSPAPALMILVVTAGVFVVAFRRRR